MAIQDSFNVSKAQTSQAYAYKCWYNYNYGGNTMQISADDINTITQTWSGELVNWRANAENDENAYEIEDDDFSDAVASGRANAQDKTGYEGGGGGKMIANSVGDGVAGAANAVLSSGVANGLVGAIGGGTGLMSTSTGLIGSTITKVGAEKGVEAAKDVATKGNNAGSWIIGAPLTLTTGIKYMAQKPNKDQKEACDALQDEMTNAQSAVYTAQEEMYAMGDELVELSDEAQVYNEDANEGLEEQQTQLEMYKASYEALKAKIESGQPLTQEEKALMQELVTVMQELGISMGESIEETGETVTEIYDEMGTYQEGYDVAAETIGEVQGLTDYAESFDEATRTSCYIEAGAQTLNAGSGLLHAAKASQFAASGGIFTAWAWGFAAMGAAGAAMSTTGVTQQFKWAGEVGTEIGMREATQELNSATNDIYDESIEGYEGYMAGVEELELEVPETLEEDMAALEEASVETPGTSGGAGATGATDGKTAGVTGTSGTTGTAGASGGFGIPAKDETDKKPEEEA